MSLASQFGDQGAYKCNSCGHTMALYAPCCPRCLDNTLVQVRTEKSPTGFRRVSEEPADTPKPGNPVAAFAILAIILAIAATVYNTFGPSGTESTTKTEANVVTAPTSAASSSNARVSNNQSSKRNKRANARPVVSKTQSSAQTTNTKPAAQMKLWQASDDDGD